MIGEILDNITAETIRDFIRSKVTEGRTIEYKQTLPDVSNDKKKWEYLADVSSFANAVGGDILYGVPAERDASGKPTGAPLDAVGVATTSPDAEQLRLTSIIRDGLDPRLPLVDLKFVDGFALGPVLVLRVGQSWSAPHMVKGTSKFHTRSSAGKYDLDVRELRAAFAASEAVPQRMQRFLDERLARIASGQSALGNSPSSIVIHVMPVAAFDRTPQEVPRVNRFDSLVSPYFSSAPRTHGTKRFNFEGFLQRVAERDNNHRPLPNGGAYVQAFRTGTVEGACALETEEGPFKDWFPLGIGLNLAECSQHYIKTMHDLGVPLPYVFALTLLGVKGRKLNTVNIPIDIRAQIGEYPLPFDRDTILLPDVLIEEVTADAADLIRPALDAMWQTGGFPRYFSDR